MRAVRIVSVARDGRSGALKRSRAPVELTAGETLL